MFKFSALAVLTAMFFACGDDVTKVTQVTQETSGLEVVSSADSLGECTAEHSGEMKFASKENTVFVCADSAWQNVSAAGKASCAAEILKDSSGYKIVCNGDSVGVIFNGKDGLDGENGKAGAAGKDGETCSLTDNGDGTLLQVCGKDSVVLYKAFCGDKPFDPTKSFCVADSAVSLCGGKIYDLSKNFCFKDSIYDVCGWNKFSPETHFCFGDSLYQRCNGVIYNPSNEMCFNDSVHELCGGKIFDPQEYTCDEGRLFGRLNDVRDDRIYKTVWIGEHLWMAENLNYAYMPDTLSFCYKDSAEYCKKYGRHYRWSAAMDSAARFSDNGEDCGDGETCSPTYPVRGVCPDGWHLPTADEWEELLAVCGNDGKLCKSASDWDGTDSVGFSALPAGYLAGYLMTKDILFGVGRAFFWSATPDTEKQWAYYFAIDLTEKNGETKAFVTFLGQRMYGFSVRCVKDFN